MEIISILAIIVVGIIAFLVGWKVAIHPDIISNEKAIEEQRRLKIENNTEKERLNTLKLEQKHAKEQCQEMRQHINDIEKDAERIYENKIAQLEKEYQQKITELSKREEEILNQYAADRQKEEAQLESLKATKAAAIEAARKEKLINRKQEDFCLRIPIEEQNDVSILKSVRNRITKPRAVSMVIWSQYYQPVAKKIFPQILGSEDKCGIYKITNQETGECYIGQAKDVRKRWNEHAKCGLSIDTPQGNKLYKAMQEYGLEHFSFELLEECPAEELNEKERYFISLYSADTLGYNSNKGVK